MKDTADIRAKLLEVWRQVNEKKLTTSEARLQIGLARAILDSLKVEIAAAHLATAEIPPLSIGPGPRALPLRKNSRRLDRGH